MMMKGLFFALVAGVSALELTSETWDAETSGKTVFIKFYAPWCGHCKAMKPDWDKLMEEFKDHPSILIADVDCIGEGADLCSEHEVQGFPTIKHGDVSDLQDYEGERSYDELAAFAKELKPTCSPFNIDLCDEDGKKEIEALQALSDDDLSDKVKEGTDDINAANEHFEAEVEKLQAAYEKLSEEKDAAIAKVRASGMSLAKAVLAARTKPAGEEKEEL